MQKFIIFILTVAMLILAVTYGQVLVLQQSLALGAAAPANATVQYTIFQNIWLSMLVGLFISGLCSLIVMILYRHKRKTRSKQQGKEKQ